LLVLVEVVEEAVSAAPFLLFFFFVFFDMAVSLPLAAVF